MSDQVPNIRMLANRIVVRRLKGSEKTPGGIIIPENAKDPALEGIVVAAGPGRYLEDGTRAPLDVKVGDRVMFQKWVDTNTLSPFVFPELEHPEDFIIMFDGDVMAVVEDPELRVETPV